MSISKKAYLGCEDQMRCCKWNFFKKVLWYSCDEKKIPLFGNSSQDISKRDKWSWPLFISLNDSTMISTATQAIY